MPLTKHYITLLGCLDRSELISLSLSHTDIFLFLWLWAEWLGNWPTFIKPVWICIDHCVVLAVSVCVCVC